MLKMHCFRSILLAAAAGLLLAAGVPHAAPAQSVEAVIDEMKARYQQQLDAVDTYIIETDQYTSYHRKTTRDGTATYETAVRWTDNPNSLFRGAETMPAMQPSLAQLDTLAQRAVYLGTETVDGQRCHVLRIDDPAALSDAPMPPAASAAQGTMRLYIDAARYVPLRIEIETTVEQDGTSRTMRPRIAFGDYRTTDGLTLPWSMEMTMEDLNAAISPEEREQARQSLEEMEQRMKEMPEQQRQMMEGMMKEQLEQLRRILDEGSIRFAVTVQDVRVNTPLPDDVFEDGSN